MELLYYADAPGITPRDRAKYEPAFIEQTVAAAKLMKAFPGRLN